MMKAWTALALLHLTAVSGCAAEEPSSRRSSASAASPANEAIESDGNEVKDTDASLPEVSDVNLDVSKGFDGQGRLEQSNRRIDFGHFLRILDYASYYKTQAVMGWLPKEHGEIYDYAVKVIEIYRGAGLTEARATRNSMQILVDNAVRLHREGFPNPQEKELRGAAHGHAAVLHAINTAFEPTFFKYVEDRALAIAQVYVGLPLPESFQDGSRERAVADVKKQATLKALEHFRSVIKLQYVIRDPGLLEHHRYEAQRARNDRLTYQDTYPDTTYYRGKLLDAWRAEQFNQVLYDQLKW